VFLLSLKNRLDEMERLMGISGLKVVARFED